ncbi:Hypothetical protein FKW44_023194, partial [Caligus rogercresseyi]
NTSVKEGTFFAESSLPLRKQLLLMALWSKQNRVTDASNESEVSRFSAMRMFESL